MIGHRDEQLEQALEKARALEPSQALKARLEQALVRAEHAERAHSLERMKKRANLVSHLRLALPALGSLAVAAHLLLVEPEFSVEEPEFAGVAEHVVDMPEQGHVAIPLSLSLDEHDSEYAAVRLGVPHGVRVTPSDQAISARQPDCDHTGCVYEFVHPTGAAAPHVEVRVEKPGRYRVDVQHASETKTMREIIVVHARR
jgi:hypothetical protein